MRKLITLWLLLISSFSFAQTWEGGLGNTLQRTPTSKGYRYRFALGSGKGTLETTPSERLDSLLALKARKDSTFNINKNLGDIVNASTARNNLGITTLLTLKEDVVNKAPDFSIIDNLKYPTTFAVANFVKYERNAANFGLTATLADVAHYTDVANVAATYRVGGWINLLTTTGKTVSLQVTFSYNGITKTKLFYPQGITNNVLSTADDYAFPTMDFRASANSTIQVSAIVSGSGTITYEAGATIQKINGN